MFQPCINSILLSKRTTPYPSGRAYVRACLGLTCARPSRGVLFVPNQKTSRFATFSVAWMFGPGIAAQLCWLPISRKLGSVIFHRHDHHEAPPSTLRLLRVSTLTTSILFIIVRPCETTAAPRLQPFGPIKTLETRGNLQPRTLSSGRIARPGPRGSCIAPDGTDRINKRHPIRWEYQDKGKWVSR